MPKCAVLQDVQPKYKVGDFMRFSCYLVTIIKVAGRTLDGEYFYQCKFQFPHTDMIWESDLKPYEVVDNRWEIEVVA